MGRIELVFPFIIPSKKVLELLNDKGYEAKVIIESKTIIGEIESFNYMVAPFSMDQTNWTKTSYYIKAKNKDEEVIFFVEYNDVMFTPIKKYDLYEQNGAMTIMVFQSSDSIVQKIIMEDLPIGRIAPD